MVYPLTFCIPADRIVETMPKKTKWVSDLIPGKLSTYVYTTQEDYYAEYRSSVFAITCKKGGWDCMRHYEILSQGCIPLFLDLDACPPDTMTHFPKDLVKELMNRYAPMKGLRSLDDPALQEMLSADIQKLLDYTRKNLTVEAMASYILDTVGRRDAREVLILSGSTDPDYMRCLLVQGFKGLLGQAAHDYPPIPHIYTSFHPSIPLYGRGFSYARNLDPALHDAQRDATLLADIVSHRYDLIIYGSFHRGMPFWEQIKASYKPTEILCVCGEDLHVCDGDRFSACHVFTREL